jgi:hypothetical protein
MVARRPAAGTHTELDDHVLGAPLTVVSQLSRALGPPRQWRDIGTFSAVTVAKAVQLTYCRDDSDYVALLRTDREGRTAMKRWNMWGTTAVLVAFVVGSGVVVAAAWLTQGLDGTAIRAAVITLVGVMALITAVAGLAIVFDELGLTTGRQALGLPQGSVRALLAFTLVIAFVGISIYLGVTVFSKKSPSDAQLSAATALESVIATLVTAIAAFYFGTNAVKTGASVVAGAQPPAANEARATVHSVTKIDDEWRLIGVADPGGAKGRAWFRYGRDEKNLATDTPQQGLDGVAIAVEARLPGDRLDTDHFVQLVVSPLGGTEATSMPPFKVTRA